MTHPYNTSNFLSSNQLAMAHSRSNSVNNLPKSDSRPKVLSKSQLAHLNSQSPELLAKQKASRVTKLDQSDINHLRDHPSAIQLVLG